MSSRRHTFPILALVLSVAAACDNKPKPVSDPKAATTELPAATTSSVTPREAPPKVEMPAPADAQKVAKASNAFAFDLYARLSKGDGNLAFSPASITTALAMVWVGSRGETDKQIRKVLHVDGERDAVAASWGKLAQALQDPSRPLKLRIANRLFGQRDYKFEQPYLDLTRSAFGAPLDPVDFKGAPNEQRVKINGWVEERTEKRIKDLLPPQAINADTRLVVVNAIYFLADWLTPFKQEATSPAPFSVGGAKKNVPTMRNMARFKLTQADGVKMLEMPYMGDATAMYVVLPDEGDGLPAVEKAMTPAKLEAWTAALSSQNVDVTLPSFTIDPPSAILLSGELRALGMPTAFDPEQADFFGIATPPDPKQRLYVSEVFHKAFVKVDEKGTEAAAATAIVMVEGAARPLKAVEFHADHPFLFFIVDKTSSTILFMGRVTDPAGRG